MQQTLALWVRNNNYDKKHKLCFFGMQFEAGVYKVKLFQRKTVYDILWGYKDPFLEFLVKATQGIHIPIIGNITCPGQDGLTDIVQLQVSDQKYYSPLLLLLLKGCQKKTISRFKALESGIELVQLAQCKWLPSVSFDTRKTEIIICTNPSEVAKSNSLLYKWSIFSWANFFCGNMTTL